MIKLCTVSVCFQFGQIHKQILQGFSVDQNTVKQAQAKIDNFTFASLWFSGFASLLSLVVGQYTAFKVYNIKSYQFLIA